MFTLAGAGSHLSRKKSYSSVDFPSLWATGLGRSGIGPEAGGGGWEVGRGGSYGGGAAATCETQVSRCSARRASTALVLPAGDSNTLLQLHPSRVEASPQQGGHSRKARGSCSTAGLPRTTSHPCSTETGDCQSGGGVAAISSKNIFLLSEEEKYQ